MVKVRILARQTTLEKLHEDMVRKRTKGGVTPCAAYINPEDLGIDTKVVKFYAQSLMLNKSSVLAFWRRPSLTIYGYIHKKYTQDKRKVVREPIKVIINAPIYFIDEPGVSLDTGVVYFGGFSIKVMHYPDKATLVGL